MKHERRQEARIKSLNLVRVRERGSPGPGVLGRTLDLSREGARLEVERAFPLESRVCFSLALGNLVLELEGRVRSLRERGAHRFELGLQLYELDPYAYEDLDEFLQLQAG